MMKKLLIVLFSLCILMVPFRNAHALSVSVGANLWYTWWDPAWRDGIYEIIFDAPYPFPPPSRLIGYQKANMPDAPVISAFTYGPALSLRAGRVSISTVFMYARYNIEYSGLMTVSNYFINIPVTATDSPYLITKREITRMDTDTTVSYSINRALSFVMGLKIQNYSVDSSTWDTTSGLTKLSTSFLTIGPGLGLSVTLPLVADVYIIWNGTGFFLWSRQGARKAGLTNGTVSYFDDGRYLSLGGTTSLSLAYVFSSINTTLSWGLRYQVLWYKKLDTRSGILNVDRKMDHYYGISMAAIYAFNFSGDD